MRTDLISERIPNIPREILDQLARANEQPAIHRYVQLHNSFELIVSRSSFRPPSCACRSVPDNNVRQRVTEDAKKWQPAGHSQNKGPLRAASHAT